MLAMGRWGCWLAVAVHVVVRGKEAMLIHISKFLRLNRVWLNPQTSAASSAFSSLSHFTISEDLLATLMKIPFQ